MYRLLVVLALVAGCDWVFGFEVPALDAGGQVEPRCDVPAGFADGLTPARTLHVAPVGAATPDGSEAAPFGTIADAAAVATPGTRILLASGTYPGQDVGIVHGDAEAPIWIEGPATGVRATFTGGIELMQPRHVVVRHLDIVGAAYAVFAWDGDDRTPGIAHHLAIDDVQATAVTDMAFRILGVDDVSIVRSSCDRCERGVFLLGVHRAVIARMEIRDTVVTGIQAAGGSTEIDIRQNVIERAGTRAIWVGGGSDELEFRPPLTAADGNFEASRVRVVNNVIRDSGTGILCGLCTDTLIAANFFNGLAITAALRLFEEHLAIGAHAFAPSGPLRVIDNVFEVSADGLVVDVVGTTAAAGSTFDSNLWLAVDTPAMSMPTLPAPETRGIYGVRSGYGPDGDLCDGAAVGAGIAVPEVDGTLDGRCRTAAPSIGPNEPTPGC